MGASSSNAMLTEESENILKDCGNIKKFDEEHEAKVVTKDLDEVLETIGFGWWQFQMLLIVCFGTISDAMEVTVLSFLTPCVKEEWALKPSEASSVTGMVFAGQLLGAVVFGRYADKTGRKPMFIASLVVLAVFGIATYFTMELATLLLCRFFVGFGAGGASVSFDYLAESVPRSLRGRLCLIVALTWALGGLLVAGLAWAFLTIRGWRFLTLLCTIPVLVTLPFTFRIPESPRWLLHQNRTEEAVQALKKGAASNGNVLGEFTLQTPVIKDYCTDLMNNFSPAERAKTMSITVMSLGIGFCLYGITLLISIIFEHSDTCSFQYESIFISVSSEGLAILTAIVFCECEHSRRLSFIVPVAVASVAVILMGTKLQASGYLTLFAFIARGACRMGGAVAYIMVPELFRTEVRATAHAFQSSMSRIGAFIAAFWVYADVGRGMICGLIAIVGFITAAASIWLPETGGVNLDIDLSRHSSICTVKRKTTEDQTQDAPFQYSATSDEPITLL